MANTLKFNFKENYSVEIKSEDIQIIIKNLDSVLSCVSSPAYSEETKIEYITGERDRIIDENEVMYFDRWAVSIYSPDNESTRFIKKIGDSAVQVRALNIITQKYDDFTLEVSLAVEVIRDLLDFLFTQLPGRMKTD